MKLKKEEVIAAAKEMNLIIKPKPPIKTSADITVKDMFNKVVTAAGLLEPGDTVSYETDCFFKAQGVEHKAGVTPGPDPKPENKKADTGKKKKTAADTGKKTEPKKSETGKKAADKKVKSKKGPSCFGIAVDIICKNPDMDRSKFMKAVEKKAGELFKETATATAYSSVTGIVKKLRANKLM